MTAKERAAKAKDRASKLLQRYEDRPIIQVAVLLHQRDRQAAGTLVGSAIAFRLFLFFIPLLLFAVGVLGFIGERWRASEVNDAVGVQGQLATQIASALAQPNTTRWIAVLLGLVGMATAGRSLSKVLISASCLAWGLPVESKVSVKVVGAVVGLVVGVGFMSALVGRARAQLGIAVTGASFAVAFAIYLAIWLVLTAMLRRATSDVGALLPGAVLLSVTLVGMQAVSVLYLPDQFERASALYGAIGTSVVTLGWFFILGRVIPVALALDAVIHERFGSVARFVFALPILRQLARHSKLIRRIFNLE
jgi:uncharacterized BrkB/YihY/UPF0761 family membrane protein